MSPPNMKPINLFRISAKTPAAEKWVSYAKSKALAVKEVMDDIGIKDYKKFIDLEDGGQLLIKGSSAGNDHISNLVIKSREELEEEARMAGFEPEVFVPPTYDIPMYDEEVEAIPLPEIPEPLDVEVVPGPEYYVGLEFVVTDTAQLGSFTNYSDRVIGGTKQWPERGLTSCTAFWKITKRPTPETWEEGDRSPQVVNILTDKPDFVFAGVGCHDPRYEQVQGGYLWPARFAPHYAMGSSRLWELNRTNEHWKVRFTSDPTDSHYYPDIERVDYYDIPNSNDFRFWFTSHFGYNLRGDYGHNLPLSYDTNLTELFNRDNIEGGTVRLHNDGKVEATFAGQTLSVDLDVGVTGHPTGSDWQTFSKDKLHEDFGYINQTGNFPPGTVIGMGQWWDDRGSINGSVCAYEEPGVGIGITTEVATATDSPTFGGIVSQPSTAGKWTAYPFRWGTNPNYYIRIENDLEDLTDLSKINARYRNFDYAYWAGRKKAQPLLTISLYNGLFSEELESDPDASWQQDLFDLGGGGSASIVQGWHIGRSLFYVDVVGTTPVAEWLPRGKIDPKCGAMRGSFYAVATSGLNMVLFYLDSSPGRFRWDVSTTGMGVAVILPRSGDPYPIYTADPRQNIQPFCFNYYRNVMNLTASARCPDNAWGYLKLPFAMISNEKFLEQWLHTGYGVGWPGDVVGGTGEVQLYQDIQPFVWENVKLINPDIDGVFRDNVVESITGYMPLSTGGSAGVEDGGKNVFKLYIGLPVKGAVEEEEV